MFAHNTECRVSKNPLNLLGLMIVCPLLLLAGVSHAATTQLDFSSVFNANVVRNASDDICNFDGLNRCYVSSARALNASRPEGLGLPDQGLFVANAEHPEVELAPFNASPAANNAWKASGIGSTNFTVVPAGSYAALHLFAAAGGANPASPATMRITLRYSDSSSTTSDSISVPDWFGDATAAGSYYLRDEMDRFNDGVYETAEDTAVFGFALRADPSKTLDSIDVIIDAIPTNGVFVLFGATATTDGSTTLPPVVTAVDPARGPAGGGYSDQDYGQQLY